MKLSIIIPLFNEAENVERLCISLQRSLYGSTEIIFVDGGSTDNSLHRLHDSASTHLSEHCCVFLDGPKGRALQMNEGTKFATGEALLFLHADSCLPQNADKLILDALQSSLWGRFDVRLDSYHLAFRVIEWFINHRSALTKVCTGDQCVFVLNSVFGRLGGFAEIPLMEDVELTKRLRSLADPQRIKIPATTSTRKWEKGGIVATVLLMWRLRYQYWKGVDPKHLVTKYYD